MQCHLAPPTHCTPVAPVLALPWPGAAEPAEVFAAGNPRGVQQGVSQPSGQPTAPEHGRNPLCAIAPHAARPEARRMALFLRFQEGQAVIARTGLLALLNAPVPA
jgi:hypothetical protein